MTSPVQTESSFIPYADAAARESSTKFPLDGLKFDISSMSEETLIAYGEAAPVLHSLGGVRVVRLSQKLALKSGVGIVASEGETMQYVTRHYPGVRLPTVHRCFNVDDEGSSADPKGYIVMDYLDASSLDSCWSQLGSEKQRDIVTQVAEMINELQSINLENPGVIGGGVSRGIWFSDYGAGPFTTKANFEEWLNWKLALSQYYKHADMDIPLVDYPYFVLVHGDISPRNLVLDSENRVWLIDWGCAGVYPPIFESASIKHQIHFPDFSQLLLPLIYTNRDEMNQLESCSFGINSVSHSLPP